MDVIIYVTAYEGQDYSAAEEFLRLTEAFSALAARAAPDGIWNSRPWILGDFYYWHDASDNLRRKKGVPTSDTDGAIVFP